jgi:hypothetical protein
MPFFTKYGIGCCYNLQPLNGNCELMCLVGLQQVHVTPLGTKLIRSAQVKSVYFISVGRCIGYCGVNSGNEVTSTCQVETH